MSSEGTLTLKQERRIIRRTGARLILPLIAENILSMLAGMVNSALLGHVDRIGLDSVFEVSVQGVGTSLTGLFWNLFRGLCIMATVLIARADGEERPERAAPIMRFMIAVMLGLGSLVGLGMALGAPVLAGIYRLEPEVHGQAVFYLRTAALGMPALAVLQAVICSLQGKGNTRVPMLLSTFMNLVNLSVSAVLIYGGPIPILRGAVGTAVAIVIAEYLAVTLGILYLRRAYLSDTAQTVRPPTAGLFRSLWTLGVPSALEHMSWRVATIFLGRIIMQIGMVAYTANNIGVQAEALTYMPAVGFGVAATTLTGRAIGARDARLGRLTIRELVKGVILAISVGTLALLFFPEQLMRLLSSQPEVIRLGAIYLFLMGLIQIPQNVTSTLVGALRGSGNTRAPMLIAWFGLWGVRVLGVTVAYHGFGIGIVGVWLIVCLDIVVRFLLAVWTYRRSRIWDFET